MKRTVLFMTALLSAIGPAAAAELAVVKGQYGLVLKNIGPSPVIVSGARYNGKDACEVAVFQSRPGDASSSHFNDPTYRLAVRVDNIELQAGATISLAGRTACNTGGSLASITVDLVGEPSVEVKIR